MQASEENARRWRLNKLAKRTARRIQDYVGKRPMLSRETRERQEYSVFAKTYRDAQTNAFAGDIESWVWYCNNVLRRLERIAIKSRAPWVRHAWDRVVCFFRGHDWYTYKVDKRICTRCLNADQLIQEVWIPYRTAEQPAGGEQ